MGKHARLSASQTKQWWKCPGSTAVLETRPDLKRASGYHAQMGTCAHALVEKCLEEGSEPEDYRDRIIVIIEDDDGGESTSILRKNAKTPKDPQTVWFEVDTEMIDAVDVMTTYVRARLVELGAIPGGDAPDEARAAAECKELQLESYTIPIPERDDTGGTADVTIDIFLEVLEIIDYKHGSGVFVPVEGNYQLRSYILGKAIETQFSHDVYRYTIVQPRHPEGGVQSEEITRAELQAWAKDLGLAAERVDVAREKVSAGAGVDELFEEGLISVGDDGSHCTFCDLKTGCPAIFAKAQDLASVDFEDEPDADKLETPGENRLHIVLPWVKLIDSWIRDMEAEAERLLMQGRSIEGYKLVRKRSNRQWVPTCYVDLEGDGEEVPVPVDEENLLELMETEFNLDEADMYAAPKLISGPQAEKLLTKDDRGRFNQVMLHKPEGGLTMVPEGDKREAVSVDPAADFDDDLED